MQIRPTVEEVAAHNGLSVPAHCFYERKELFRSQRTLVDQRRCSRDVLRRIVVCGFLPVTTNIASVAKKRSS